MIDQILKAYQTICCKVDIPEVQAFVELLTPQVNSAWEQAYADIIVELDAQLDALGDVNTEEMEDKFLQDFITAVLLSLFTIGDRATVDTRVVLPAARDLLLTGGEIDFTRGRATRIVQLANQDLDFWVGQRARGREEPLRAALSEYLKTPKIIRDRETLHLAVEQALADPGGRVGRALTDVWAYRHHNVGGVLSVVPGASEAGTVEVLQAFNNPPFGPDGKTTPFCREMHLRPLRVDVLNRQIDRYYRAIDLGDAEAAKAAWPLLPADAAALATGFEQIAQDFGIGLPPYHFFCRTSVRRRVVA